MKHVTSKIVLFSMIRVCVVVYFKRVKTLIHPANLYEVSRLFR